jgi:hypothetical protein
MVKLVDTPASGAGDRKVVEVRVFFWAPIQTKPSQALGFVLLGVWIPTSAYFPSPAICLRPDKLKRGVVSSGLPASVVVPPAIIFAYKKQKAA